MLAQWLAETNPDTSAAWLSLDDGDNDFRRFLTHLVAAMRTLDAGMATDADALLASPGTVAAQAILTSLINDLDARAGQTILTLDDYHLIVEPTVHDAVAFLLEHAPPNLSIAMATRSDPPLPLARLRSRGDLVEIRAADLRFTPTEADDFLNHLMGLQIDRAHVAALDARTEGWIAGLQLAALSMRGRDDPAAFVDAFSGSHRFVLDYLVEEVMAQFTPPLCDALTARDDARSTIEALERGNLFVIPLDDRRQWYRYHHLFADTLRARLAEDPDHRRSLHRAASDWFAGNGFHEEAIEHALAGSDDARAAELIERALPEARRHRQDRALRRWLTALPDDQIQQRPLLSTQYAWLRLVQGHLDGVELWLRHAEHSLASRLRDGDPNPQDPTTDTEVRAIPASIEMYRAAAAQARGDIEGTALHAERALAHTAPDDHAARVGGLGFLGLAAWARGELDAATTTFSQAMDSMRAAGNLADALGSTVVLSELWLARGDPREAQRLYERALEEAQRHPSGLLATTGDLHVGLTDVLRERGELDPAEHHLIAGRALGEGATLLENRHRWHVAMAGLLRARGELDEAVGQLERAKSLYLPGFFPDVHPIPAAIARVRIAQGRLDDAGHWADEHPIAAETGLAHLAEYDHLTLVRLHVADGRIDPALELLDRIEQSARVTARGRTVIELQFLRALAHHARGESITRWPRCTNPFHSAFRPASSGSSWTKASRWRDCCDSPPG